MPTRIVKDQTVRLVTLEHHCKDGGSTYRGYVETPGKNPPWRGRHCPDCGEKLPQTVAEVEGA